MKTLVTKLGYAFDCYTFKYEYVCVNTKNSFTWGIGSDSNNPEVIANLLESCKGTDEDVPCIDQTSIEISSLRKGETYSVNGIIIICIKGDK